MNNKKIVGVFYEIYAYDYDHCKRKINEKVINDQNVIEHCFDEYYIKLKACVFDSKNRKFQFRRVRSSDIDKAIIKRYSGYTSRIYSTLYDLKQLGIYSIDKMNEVIESIQKTKDYFTPSFVEEYSNTEECLKRKRQMQYLLNMKQELESALSDIDKNRYK